MAWRFTPITRSGDEPRGGLGREFRANMADVKDDPKFTRTKVGTSNINFRGCFFRQILEIAQFCFVNPEFPLQGTTVVTLGEFMKSKFVCGALAASVLLLQSQAALAVCGPLGINGKWNLVGSLYKAAGEESYAFYCNQLTLVMVGNKYSAQANCGGLSGGASGAYTVAATSSIAINPQTCKVSGTFVLTHQGNSVPVTILSGTFANPVGNVPSKQGQFVARDALDAAVLTFTLLR